MARTKYNFGPFALRSNQSSGNNRSTSNSQIHSSNHDMHSLGNQRHSPGSQRHSPRSQRHSSGHATHSPGNLHHSPGNQHHSSGHATHSSGNQHHSPGSNHSFGNINLESRLRGQDVDDNQDIDMEQYGDDLDDEIGALDGSQQRVGSNNNGLQPRQKLQVYGKTFEPVSANGKLRQIIHCHFKGPWINYSRVPKDVKYIWFQEFKKHFWWDEAENEVVYAIWRVKASEHIRTIFQKAREKKCKPDWIFSKHWSEMLKIWATDEKFNRDSDTNKRNRSSENPNGTSAYSGGSKSVHEHVKTFRLEHDDQEPTIEDLMAMTYQKKNGEWSGTRAEKTLERYRELVAKAEEEGVEIDHIKLWIEAAGGVKGSSVFGLGSYVGGVPRELLEKYFFCKPSQPYGTPDFLNEFKDEVEKKVSNVQNEILGIKEQLKDVVAVLGSLKVQFESFVHHQAYASTQFSFPAAHQPFMRNQFPYPHPASVGGEVTTSFTNLLNSNFFTRTSNMPIPTQHPSLGEIPRNIPSTSMNTDSQGGTSME